MKYYREDAIKKLLKVKAHTALEQMDRFISYSLRNLPCIDLPEKHGALIDEKELRKRAYEIQIRDKISHLEALGLALMEAPYILEATE